MGALVESFVDGRPGAQACDRAPGLDWPLERQRGWVCSRRLWWWLWSRCPGLGWVRLNQLWLRCPDPSLAWALPLCELLAMIGGSGRAGAAIDRFRRRWGPDPLPAVQASLRRQGPLLLPGDPAMPPAMLELDRPPLALHWHGRGSLWAPLRRRQAVAVVGTRRPSPHGLVLAEAIGSALARGGWPVVSGLAEGIDGAAHRGCLSAAGQPVAVLGTGLDRVYPRHHSALQRRVADAGLLVTEQAPQASVQPGHFAARNRLQVALAQALVVVECPESSGALHSAGLAWDQGLPIWVVPADAGKRSAAGSNRLLCTKASPLLEPEDLVRQLGPGPLLRPAAAQPSSGGGGAALDPELLEAVGPGASLEQLCRILDQPAVAVSSRLLTLELAGALRARPGLCWQPT
jgi:DNA processing protein